MRVHVFHFRYSPALGGFDTSALEQFQRNHDLLAFREHFFEVEGVPHLCCILSWQPSSGREIPMELRDELDAAPVASRSPDREARSKRRSSKRDPLEGLDDEQRSLFHSLREWRREAADKKGIPPFQVFTNAELHEIVVRRPDSANGLSQIHGIGARKVEQHAEAVLRLLAHSPAETAS